MEIIASYLFYTLCVLIVLLTIVVGLKIKLPRRDLIFDITKYGILVLVSSIIILYGKTLLGVLTFMFGLFISLLLKNKK